MKKMTKKKIIRNEIFIGRQRLFLTCWYLHIWGILSVNFGMMCWPVSSSALTLIAYVVCAPSIGITFRSFFISFNVLLRHATCDGYQRSLCVHTSRRIPFNSSVQRLPNANKNRMQRSNIHANEHWTLRSLNILQT